MLYTQYRMARKWVVACAYLILLGAKVQSEDFDLIISAKIPDREQDCFLQNPLIERSCPNWYDAHIDVLYISWLDNFPILMFITSEFKLFIQNAL